MTESNKSKVEIEKETSNYLRGTLKEQLAQNTTHFDDTVHNLLKFHGFYQQDDRDLRQKLTKEGKEKHYTFM
ncbi:MAG: NADPH-dependent assimilatory sulfite reductase hemoprotein subunit, partial [Candidatus Omnitrophica bacterium]|nr:NADPH-dependent assimilatory sulfite reductase hemoprotein subunit [Candidatus Omnitrophota bacterium]